MRMERKQGCQGEAVVISQARDNAAWTMVVAVKVGEVCLGSGCILEIEKIGFSND